MREIFKNTEEALICGKNADIEQMLKIDRAKTIYEKQYERLKNFSGMGFMEKSTKLFEIAKQIQFCNETNRAYYER